MVSNGFSQFPFIRLNFARPRGTGKNFTIEQREQGVAEQAVFREWFKDNVLDSSSNLLSNAVMIMPFGPSEPKYRDEPNK